MMMMAAANVRALRGGVRAVVEGGRGFGGGVSWSRSVDAGGTRG